MYTIFDANEIEFVHFVYVLQYVRNICKYSIKLSLKIYTTFSLSALEMDQYLYKMYIICCNTIPTFARYTDILLIAIFVIPKNCRDVLWMHSKRKSPWGFSSTMGTKGLLRYTACSKVRKAIDNCGIFPQVTLRIIQGNQQQYNLSCIH